MRVGIYARVSTAGGQQTTENQLIELRAYCQARQWTIFKEYVDEGVSGAKDRRPALDQLVADPKRRRFDVMLAWRLDRVGRNLRHLVLLLEDLQAIGVGFVSLNEGSIWGPLPVASSSTSSRRSVSSSGAGFRSG